MTSASISKSNCGGRLPKIPATVSSAINDWSPRTTDR